MGLFGKKKVKKDKESKSQKGDKLSGAKNNVSSSGNRFGSALIKPGSGKRDERKALSKSKRQDTKEAYKVLREPIISEKATFVGGENKYIFKVSIKANKHSVSNAVYNVYGIKPVKVNIINIFGKHRRQGYTKGMTSNWKKAIVTLPVGKSIEIYEGT